ncbi:MAG: Stp1/IreP family PP2C-type Ser/Thr phosphatase [Solirubrobacterales bacterium]|nr:Stp1/IreP family PP2C-type Ser/Thr phosphatase [Solirubrobacterales bacterium]MBV9799332.1 Stp1/IreP family PP2C-type Ser/Thr phosphatase [Solirubrobacterales bacterium]
MLRAAETAWKTDTGRQRKDNEDNAFARAPIFVVADGMGGAQAGEVASRIAIEAFEQGLPDRGSAEERLADRVREANRRIYERSRSEHERAGMGTTLTAAYVDDAHLAIAHVGDSRAYRFRDGSLERLTQDHSLVEELVRQQKLTPEQAAEHPQRSIITRALGPEPDVEVDTWTYAARGGDILLLCSDGLTSMVSEERVAEIIASSESLQRAADELVDEANEAGGRDNITVVLFRLEEVGDGDGDQPTMIGAAPARPDAMPSSPRPAPGPPEGGAGALAVASPRRTIPARRIPPVKAPLGERRMPRYAKVLAALAAVAVVAFLIGAGGYLATRQLYFIGTNSQGIVTIYRGLPYDLPAGIRLYETYYVSGVPASLVPADRRASVFNDSLRSQSDATSLVMDLEEGNLSR